MSSPYPVSDVEVLVRLGASMVAGIALGLEREWHAKPAGIRTYALVCEGSALFMLVSLLLGSQMVSAGYVYDPSRIASTVVQGIGFLAGGLIFVHGTRVKGLTTAAGVWVAAGIGLMLGAGFIALGLITVALTLLMLVSLGRLEQNERVRSFRSGGPASVDCEPSEPTTVE